MLKFELLIFATCLHSYNVWSLPSSFLGRRRGQDDNFHRLDDDSIRLDDDQSEFDDFNHNHFPWSLLSLMQGRQFGTPSFPGPPPPGLFLGPPPPPGFFPGPPPPEFFMPGPPPPPAFLPSPPPFFVPGPDPVWAWQGLGMSSPRYGMKMGHRKEDCRGGQPAAYDERGADYLPNTFEQYDSAKDTPYEPPQFTPGEKVPPFYPGQPPYRGIDEYDSHQPISSYQSTPHYKSTSSPY